MTIESFFIGTRISGKRYGPQSKDMQVSELIALINPQSQPEKYVLPDFSGLAKHLDGQIRQQFQQQKEDEYYRRYRLLTDIWQQAGSLSNEVNRSRRFEKVMDESQEFLVYSHDVMPKLNPNSLKYGDIAQASSKGNMYCVALLIHIIARAAFEPGSIGADPTLPNHCKWMKNWIKGTLGDYFLTKMMVNCAFFNPDNFPTLQQLNGNDEIQGVDTYLAEIARIASANPIETNTSHLGNYKIEIEYTRFSKDQFNFLQVMCDIHYRIDRIEQLLHELIAYNVVDFSEAAAAGEWINRQINRIESPEILLLPPER